MVKNTPMDRALWKKKAMAFVTRSHRHLWGKNNEDPQAFLFTRGLNNQFMKDQLMGWNKFSQQRPMENWGFESADEKLFLPSGIVIPFIVDKELRSVFIHLYDERHGNQTVLLPGSLDPTLFLRDDKRGAPGKKGEKIAVIQNLIDGLFLFQEAGQACSVIIHPDPCLPLENHLVSAIKNCAGLCIFYRPEEGVNQQMISGVPERCFYAYQSKEALKNLCLMH